MEELVPRLQSRDAQGARKEVGPELSSDANGTPLGGSEDGTSGLRGTIVGDEGGRDVFSSSKRGGGVLVFCRMKTCGRTFQN